MISKLLHLSFALLALSGCQAKKQSASAPPPPANESAVISLEEMRTMGEDFLFWTKQHVEDEQIVWEARQKLAKSEGAGAAILAKKDLDDAEEMLAKSESKVKEAAGALPMLHFSEDDFDGPDWLNIIRDYEASLRNSMIENRRDVTDGDWEARQADWAKLFALDLDQVADLFSGE